MVDIFIAGVLLEILNPTLENVSEILARFPPLYCLRIRRVVRNLVDIHTSLNVYAKVCGCSREPASYNTWLVVLNIPHFNILSIIYLFRLFTQYASPGWFIGESGETRWVRWEYAIRVSY